MGRARASKPLESIRNRRCPLAVAQVSAGVKANYTRASQSKTAEDKADELSFDYNGKKWRCSAYRSVRIRGPHDDDRNRT